MVQFNSLLTRLVTQKVSARTGAAGASYASGGQSTSVFSLGEMYNAEGDFEAVRVILFNDAQAFPVTSSLIKIAPSSIDPTSTPVDQTGATIALTQVTFNNAGSYQSYDQQLLNQTNVTAPAPVYTVTVPAISGIAANSFAWTPNLYASDWMQCLSVPRTDAGPGNLLHIRYVCGGGTSPGTAFRVKLAGGTGSSVYTDRLKTSWYAGGDYVTNNNSFGDNKTDNIDSFAAIQFIMTNQSLQVQIIGESVASGVGSRSDLQGFAHMACSTVSTPTLPVVLCNSAQGAAPYTNAMQSGLQDLKLLGRMSVVILMTWDGNDATAAMTAVQTTAQVNLQWAECMAMAQAVRAQGGVPIFITPVPNCQAQNQENGRLTTLARVRALRDAGELIVDLEPLIGDGGARQGTINSLSAATGTADNIHPGVAGHTLIANVLAPILASLAATGPQRNF